MPRGVSRYDEAQLQGRLWRPSTVAPNLVGWWDADDLSTITVSTGVSEWRDKSGNGRHLSQATSGNQPALNLNNLNGRNTIKFTRSSSNRLDLSNFPTTGITELGVYFVTKWLTTGTSVVNDTQSLIDNNNAATSGWVFQDRPDLTNKPLQAAYSPAPGSGASYGAVDTAQTGNDAWKIVGGVFVGGASGSATLFDGGTQRASTSNTNTLTLNASLRIGGFLSGNSRHFNGAFAEIIIVSNATAIVRQRIEGYLAWKWGLASSLDASHPFYNRPPLIGAI